MIVACETQKSPDWLADGQRQVLPDLIQRPDVVPANIRNRREALALGRRLHLGHGHLGRGAGGGEGGIFESLGNGRRGRRRHLSLIPGGRQTASRMQDMQTAKLPHCQDRDLHNLDPRQQNYQIGFGARACWGPNRIKSVWPKTRGTDSWQEIPVQPRRFRAESCLTVCREGCPGFIILLRIYLKVRHRE